MVRIPDFSNAFDLYAFAGIKTSTKFQLELKTCLISDFTKVLTLPLLGKPQGSSLS